MKEIRPGIFSEDAYLGVILWAFVCPHGTIYIDAPLKGEDARAWRSALLNHHGGNHRLLVLLDSHIDRTISAKALDCPILVHEKAVSAFRSRSGVLRGQLSENSSEWEGYLETIATRWTVPDITFTDQLFLHWGGPEIRLEHHPGPAPGAIWVVVPSENVLLIGDTVVVNQPPFLGSADLEAWQQTLEVLAADYSHFQIYSSRSGLVTLEDIHHQLDFLKELQKHLEQLPSQNVTPEVVSRLVPTLLSLFDFSEDKEDLYAKRLQNGLVEYLLRRNRPIPEEEPEMGEPLEDELEA